MASMLGGFHMAGWVPFNNRKFIMNEAYTPYMVCIATLSASTLIKLVPEYEKLGKRRCYFEKMYAGDSYGVFSTQMFATMLLITLEMILNMGNPFYMENGPKALAIIRDLHWGIYMNRSHGPGVLGEVVYIDHIINLLKWLILNIYGSHSKYEYCIPCSVYDGQSTTSFIKGMLKHTIESDPHFAHVMRHVLNIVRYEAESEKNNEAPCCIS